MKVQIFKSIALVLCILILFMTVLPQAQAGWGFWKCLIVSSALKGLFVAACLICATPDPSIIGCVAAWAAYFGLNREYRRNCR